MRWGYLEPGQQILGAFLVVRGSSYVCMFCEKVGFLGESSSRQLPNPLTSLPPALICTH